MEYTDRIISDSTIMLGKPVIKGTRITVEFIIKKLSEGMEIKDIIHSYPALKKEDIIAALAYSAEVLANEAIIET
ncbi:MAG: DUF433 domain-containing protein [Fidelibacterota bacterium]